MEKAIDFRSDTITVPDKSVLERLYSADVGDDVYMEDKETTRLEESVSSLFGKEAGLFVPTGTMANLIALILYSQDGGEVILDKNSHPVHYESGGMWRIAGLAPSFAQDNQGILNIESIRTLIREDIYYQPKTVLIWLENTHNRGGGSVYPINTLEEIFLLSREHNLPLHIDGARILNASVYLEKEPSEIARYCDSLSVCFSKGLSCPLGSIIIGSREFITRARRCRKMLGGGMRQTGYISYIALHYLSDYKAILSQDHIKAEKLYIALKELGIGKAIWGGTNIIMHKFPNSRLKDIFESALKDKGILVSSLSHDSIRIVTSRAQTYLEIERAVKILNSINISA